MILYIFSALGLILLLKGAEWLVTGASMIAYRLRVTPLVIGLTIVAFGTSAPEFTVNIYAAYTGNTDIAIGNILGSNIANVFLILGVSAIIYPLKAMGSTVKKEIPFALFVATLLIFLVSDHIWGNYIFTGLSIWDGLILLAFFLGFLVYTFRIPLKEYDAFDSESVPAASFPKAVGLVIIGLAGLVLGGKWIVDGAVEFAMRMGMSEALVGLTVVAVGTSLPELATSAVAAYKKQSDIAIGNVVGSNIFNTLLILGASALVNPLPFSQAYYFDLAANFLACLILWVFLILNKTHTLGRFKGGLLLAVYVGYILFLIFK
ncbi:calcium/sodium antiporter [Litoribacter alkaliphilus]|uniref:Calcium/sodium antiporter n=1 Tax=Litoribacter ruber TaxID=702568 RepID=A0AAP2CGE7_9BACT|nr:calcium/sodium antiporter [Litoribacter alkaliphilus]MBS9523119.1 calcium/sodium antiporter [Litoribacter alkaliphilus]